MLKGDLYNIKQFQYSNELLKAEIVLNEKHAIFKGHFPDIPVLPGVIMMQMVKELLGEVEGRPMQIAKSGNMKFLQMINPQKSPLLLFEIKIIEKTKDAIRIKAQMIDKEIICFKITAQLSFV